MGEKIPVFDEFGRWLGDFIPADTEGLGGCFVLIFALIFVALFAITLGFPIWLLIKGVNLWKKGKRNEAILCWGVVTFLVSIPFIVILGTATVAGITAIEETALKERAGRVIEISTPTLRSEGDAYEFTATLYNSDFLPRLLEVSGNITIEWGDGKKEFFEGKNEDYQYVDIPSGESRMISLIVRLDSDWERPFLITGVTPGVRINRVDPSELMGARAVATAYANDEARIRQAIAENQLVISVIHVGSVATHGKWKIGFIVDLANKTLQSFFVDLTLTFRLDCSDILPEYTVKQIRIPPQGSTRVSQEFEMCYDVSPEGLDCGLQVIVGWNEDVINRCRITTLPPQLEPSK